VGAIVDAAEELGGGAPGQMIGGVRPAGAFINLLEFPGRSASKKAVATIVVGDNKGGLFTGKDGKNVFHGFVLLAWIKVPVRMAERVELSARARFL